MKRRLRNEITTKKNYRQPVPESDEAKEFEASLIKLAELAKNKVTLSDFSPADKTHILDLFVNNEKTLLKIFEALFPHRTD